MVELTKLDIPRDLVISTTVTSFKQALNLLFNFYSHQFMSKPGFRYRLTTK